MIYNAEISAGSLMLVESKQLAQLVLKGLSDEQWRSAVEGDNILQKKTPATAKRQATLIKKRLHLIEMPIVERIAHGDNELATQLLFAASMLHSQLLFDFMIKVYAMHVRRLDQRLSKAAWENYWEEAMLLEPKIQAWSTSTKSKLHQVILRILSQAKYIGSTKKMDMIQFHLRPEARRLLSEHHPHLIAAMEFN